MIGVAGGKVNRFGDLTGRGEAALLRFEAVEAVLFSRPPAAPAAGLALELPLGLEPRGLLLRPGFAGAVLTGAASAVLRLGLGLGLGLGVGLAGPAPALAPASVSASASLFFGLRGSGGVKFEMVIVIGGDTQSGCKRESGVGWQW